MGIRALQLKHKDVYRWEYTESYKEQNKIKIDSGTLYWCMARWGIVNSDGRLYDVFWSSGDKKFVDHEDTDNIIIEYVVNWDDIEYLYHQDSYKYHPDDLYHLYNPNNIRSGPYYKKKGATHCKHLILEKLNADLKTAEYEVDYIQRQIMDTEIALLAEEQEERWVT